jgi:hypothetical protein
MVTFVVSASQAKQTLSGHGELCLDRPHSERSPCEYQKTYHPTTVPYRCPLCGDKSRRFPRLFLHSWHVQISARPCIIDLSRRKARFPQKGQASANAFPDTSSSRAAMRPLKSSTSLGTSWSRFQIGIRSRTLRTSSIIPMETPILVS